MSCCAYDGCSACGLFSVAKLCHVNYKGYHLLFCHEHVTEMLTIYRTYKILETPHLVTTTIKWPYLTHRMSMRQLEWIFQTLAQCLELRNTFQNKLQSNLPDRERRGHAHWIQKISVAQDYIRQVLDTLHNEAVGEVEC